MKRSISDKIRLTAGGVFLLLLLWQLLAIFVGNQASVFPGPFATFRQTLVFLTKGKLYIRVLESLGRMFAGYFIAFFLALLLGTVSGNFPVFEKLLQPTVLTLKTIPTASLVFLFLIISGSRRAPLFIVILISFPILYESFVGGIRGVSREVNRAMRIDGTSFLRSNLAVRLPLALPYVSVGIASSFALAFKIEIMAEVITGDTSAGLGSLILSAQRNDPSDLVPVFAYSLIAIVLMLCIDALMERVKEEIRRKYQ